MNKKEAKVRIAGLKSELHHLKLANSKLREQRLRLQWHISTLQRALGIDVKLQTTYKGGLGPLVMSFRVIISNGAWLELLREPFMRLSLVEQAADEMEEQLEAWRENLVTEMESQ